MDALAPIFADDRVAIASGATVHLRATINTPNGQRELA
jgi:hypothetical protein